MSHARHDTIHSVTHVREKERRKCHVYAARNDAK